MRDGRDGIRWNARATRLREENIASLETMTDGYFVEALDKFSAIGSFDADSSSTSPSTCVQIEGFRQSCDIPRRRRGKDRENVKNEGICKTERGKERERETWRRWLGRKEREGGEDENVSLRKSEKTERLLCEEN